MPKFIGEFEGKVDAKGRVVLPSGLKKQLPSGSQEHLVINRGFDKCLVVYTRDDWEKETQKLEGLDSFNKLDRQFIRIFNNGATEVSLDTANRLLIPKKLGLYAEIENEVILYAYDNKIEIWSPGNYASQMDIDPDEFSKLAETVMGNRNNQNE
ncbi:MAG: division/cell wall cluster transcriptional repressor MraZ [Flavobacteriales bacterium]|nr:division/cell wall cluster transcriptional repressor MraZ [Flavobacteriales bacterium]